MSAHIEWLAAAETSVQVFTPGEEWVGAGQHRRPVLTLAQDDVIAFLRRALAARSPHPDLAPDPALPDDTRLWAALQQASGGAWGGCVYDVEAILARLGGRG
mgnify:CR=1 FL=1